MVQKRRGKGEGGREGRRRRRQRGRGGGGNKTRPVPNRRRIGNRTRGDDRGPGTGAAYHFTTKGAFTDRCTYVHQHEAARKKAARALYIMIRHFGITTKRTAAPRPPRHEFYIWKRVHARKQGNLAPPLSLSPANPDRGPNEIDPSRFPPCNATEGNLRRFANFSWIVVSCRCDRISPTCVYPR